MSRARRETGNKVAPEIIRRPSSSSDRRLRKLFNGERGLPFKRTEELWCHARSASAAAGAAFGSIAAVTAVA